MFHKPGVYIFEVPEVLDEDDPILRGFCNVLFTPARGGRSAGLSLAVAP